MPVIDAVGTPVVDLVRTEFGWCGFLWEDDSLAGIAVGHDASVDAARAAAGERISDVRVRGEIASRRALAKSKMSSEAARLAEAFIAYAEGKLVEFPRVALAYVPSTRFASAVLNACRNIPYGEVRSYGDIAELAGSPQASRAVGNVMRSNRYPILIPCHRVIAAQGRIGGYSSPRGLEFKRTLLAMEARGRDAGKGSR